jgi:hypothetical protein
MSLATVELPYDPAALRAFARQRRLQYSSRRWRARRWLARISTVLAVVALDVIGEDRIERLNKA